MQTLRETALNTRELREVRQSLRAADRYGAADSSDTDGGDRPSGTSLASLRRRSSTGSDTSQQSTLLEEIYDTVAIAGIDGDQSFTWLTMPLEAIKFSTSWKQSQYNIAPRMGSSMEANQDRRCAPYFSN